MSESAKDLPESHQDKNAQFSEHLYLAAEYLAGLDADEATDEDREKLMNELDALWPYMNEVCYISGNGLYPIFNDEGRQVDETYTYHEGRAAKSLGLAIKQLPGEERYKPYYFFELQGSSHWESYTKKIGEVSYAYLEVGSNVVPINQIDEIYHDEPIEGVRINEEMLERLQDHSDWLVAKLRSRSFRRLSSDEQLRFVNDFIDFSDEQIMLRRTGVTFEGTYCLRPRATLAEAESPVAYDYEFIPIVNFTEKAVIRGFASPERQTLHAQPIRADYSMMDVQAGLCLALEITQHMPGSELQVGEVVLLPLSSQQYRLRFLNEEGKVIPGFAFTGGIR